ncbi:MAG: hypothetical protein A3B27_01110 [Candidatus Taylorbacteria bacterium RIFCSPLOWO2_01_FULL_50_130]|nr:MAG: hypothetical protein A3B27_01110 [Candidatus Taylorbacteria bacterium RIFCSPLOWO2_01_FULL_50_130]
MNEQPKKKDPEQGNEQLEQNLTPEQDRELQPTPEQMETDALKIGDEIKILWDKVPDDLKKTAAFFDLAEGFKGDARAFAEDKLRILTGPNPKGGGEFHALEDMQRLKEKIERELGSEEVEEILKQEEERKKAERRKLSEEADQRKLAEIRRQLNTGAQTKTSPGNPEKNELATLFEGGFRESYAKAAIEYAHRIAAAEAGTPLKPGDAERKKLEFLRREAETFKEGFFGDKKKMLEQEKQLKDLKMPELLELFRKDKDGKLLKNDALIEKYKWVAASAPLAPDGVRDFRVATQFKVNVDSSGGLLFSTDKKFPHERLIYNMPILSLAFFAESEDWDKKFTTLPYLIGGRNKEIVAKGLLILNAEQRKQLKEAITARLG